MRCGAKTSGAAAGLAELAGAVAFGATDGDEAAGDVTASGVDVTAWGLGWVAGAGLGGGGWGIK